MRLRPRSFRISVGCQAVLYPSFVNVLLSDEFT
jgi:hypothetical protein